MTRDKPPPTPFRTAHWSRGAFVLVLVTVVSGCLTSVRANVSVAELERAFPTMTEMGLRSYEFRRYNDGEPVCEAINYRHGAFTTIADGTCGTFEDDGDPEQVAFDEAATRDLATLRTALAGNRGTDRQFIVIKPNPDGSVGPGSHFSADGCVDYFYSPGWTGLPTDFPDEVSKAINPNWYQTDICP